MNESIFDEILGMAVDSEFAEFENTPEHKFSLKHRLAMKKIFARYEKNIHELRKKEVYEMPQIVENKPRCSLKRQLLIATVIIILTAFLVGWVVVYISEKFHGTVTHENTQLTAKNVKDSPQTIEYKYVFTDVPEGFEMIETNSSPIHIYTLYMNETTNQTIALRQWVKSEFETYYNTEHNSFEEVYINGSVGLCIDFSDGEHDSSLVIWDNDDYVFEIRADLDKYATLTLCNLHKVKN